jgi:hypothetical protein
MSQRNRRNDNRKRQQNRRRRAAQAQPQKPKQQGGVGFWGDPEALPPARQDVRITTDPSAIARSLGPPPLPGHETIAEHYFRAVYERSVMLAGALAAAGGLIEPDELAEELGDD